MKFKLLIKLAILGAVFCNITTYGYERKTDTQKAILKEAYLQTNSYKNLPAELKKIVNDYVGKRFQIGSDSYYFLIGSKGKSRKDDLALRCVKNNKIVSISTLREIDSNFNQWLNDQHPYSLKYLQAEQSQQALYKKCLDNLELNKAVNSYKGHLIDVKKAENAYFNAWKNYALENNGTSFLPGTSSASIPKNSAPLRDNIADAASHVAANTTLSPLLKKHYKKALVPVIGAGAAKLAYDYYKKQNPAEQVQGIINSENNNVEQKTTGQIQENNNAEQKPMTYMQQFTNCCTKNPGTTIGIAAVVSGLGYGAYKLYESDFFGDSKTVSQEFE